LATITLLLLTPLAQADETITFRNDSDGYLTFWIRSESHPPKEWKSWGVGRDRTLDVKLVSPDRFKVAVTDRSSNSFVSGYIPLRSVLRDDPEMELKASAIHEAKTRTVRMWNWRLRRWENQEQMYRVSKLTMMLVNPDGETKHLPWKDDDE